MDVSPVSSVRSTEAEQEATRIEEAIAALLVAALLAPEDDDGRAWARKALAGLPLLLRRVRRLLRVHGPRLLSTSSRLVQESYERAGGQGERDLDSGLPDALETVPAVVERTFRRAVRDGSRARPEDRPKAIEQSLKREMPQGIPVQTSNARTYTLRGYTTASLKADLGQAALEGSLERAQVHGEEYVVVPVTATACGLCIPWMGKVLSLRGPALLPAMAAVAEARAAGLWHPFCQHEASTWRPGLPFPEAVQRDYRATLRETRRREIERHIRFWRWRAMTATSPEGNKAALAKYHHWRTEWSAA